MYSLSTLVYWIIVFLFFLQIMYIVCDIIYVIIWPPKHRFSKNSDQESAFFLSH